MCVKPPSLVSVGEESERGGCGSQFVEIKTAVVILLRWGNLDIRMVCIQICSPKSIADWTPLTELIFDQRMYVS